MFDHVYVCMSRWKVLCKEGQIHREQNPPPPCQRELGARRGKGQKTSSKHVLASAAAPAATTRQSASKGGCAVVDTAVTKPLAEFLHSLPMRGEIYKRQQQKDTNTKQLKDDVQQQQQEQQQYQQQQQQLSRGGTTNVENQWTGPPEQYPHSSATMLPQHGSSSRHASFVPPSRLSSDATILAGFDFDDSVFSRFLGSGGGGDTQQQQQQHHRVSEQHTNPLLLQSVSTLSQQQQQQQQLPPEDATSKRGRGLPTTMNTNLRDSLPPSSFKPLKTAAASVPGVSIDAKDTPMSLMTTDNNAGVRSTMHPPLPPPPKSTSLFQSVIFGSKI